MSEISNHKPKIFKSRRQSKISRTKKEIINPTNIENNYSVQGSPILKKTFLKPSLKCKQYLFSAKNEHLNEEPFISNHNKIENTKESKIKTRSSKLLGTLILNKDTSHSNLRKFKLLTTKDSLHSHSPLKNISSSVNCPSHKKTKVQTTLLSSNKSSLHLTQNNPFLYPMHRISYERISIECKDNDISNENTKQSSPIHSKNQMVTDLQFIMKHKPKHFASSKAGVNYLGHTKTNQDTYVYLERILGMDNFDIFGVLDGHGQNGHNVSSYVGNCIKSFFSKEKTYMISKHKHNQETKNDDSIEHDKLSYKDILQFLTGKQYKLLNMFYNKIETELTYQNFDINFSGTTCVMIYRISNTLLISNIGDSRAIIVRQINENSLTQYKSEQLSNDHKPNVPQERKRIESSGGEVKCSPEDRNDPDPIMRVWLKREKFPGIAISRTIGDEVAKTIGVINTPEIKEITLQGDECFIIVASDGIWEFLSNERVKDIVIPYYLKNDPKGAVHSLISKACIEWDNDDCARDDITCIAYFFQRKEHEQYISKMNNKNSM